MVPSLKRRWFFSQAGRLACPVCAWFYTTIFFFLVYIEPHCYVVWLSKSVHLLFCNPGLILLGEDGPSQMGLEDLSMFRAIPTATVFYPSDAVATEKAVEIAANTKVCITVFLGQIMIIFFFVLLLLLLACFLHVSTHINSFKGSSVAEGCFLCMERLQTFYSGYCRMNSLECCGPDLGRCKWLHSDCSLGLNWLRNKGKCNSCWSFANLQKVHS